MRFSRIMTTAQTRTRYVSSPVPAGKPAWVGVEEEIDLNEFFNVRNSMLLEVTGRSMEDCGIIEGDAILLSMGASPLNNDIVVVRLDREEYTVKRWRIDDNWGGQRRLYLVPANHEMEPREIMDTDSCEVVGVVKYIVKRAT
jgi:SOS-response transcriptional repressor LexA